MYVVYDSVFTVFVKQEELLKIHIKLKILVTKVFPFYRCHIRGFPKVDALLIFLDLEELKRI